MATKTDNSMNLAQAALNMAAKPDVPSPDEQAAIAAEERRLAQAEAAAVRGEQAPEVKPTEAPPATPPAAKPAEKPAPAKTNPIPTRRGRMRRPRRTVIYGPPGVGKTTLAADSTTDPNGDDLIMFDIDNGSESLDLPRYLFRPDDANRGHVPRTLEELIGGWRALRKGGHPYRRVVIDQLDRLELLVQRFILRREAANEGKDLPSIESIGYGKGKQIVLDEMRAVLNELDALITCGMDVLILAHSTTAKFANPSGADFDRHILKADKLVAGYVLEWADEVGFLHFEDNTQKVGGKRGKDKGTSTGRRLLEFDRSATWDAKARLPLPRTVVVGSANPWSFYREALARAYTMTPDDLRAEIENELVRIGDDELTPKVQLAVAGVKDNIDKLTAYMQDLRRRPALGKEEPGFTPSSTED